MVLATNLGFPRIGAKRELKKAVEAFWKGDIDGAALEKTAYDLRRLCWRAEKDAGLDQIPCNDFSLYDQVLDTIVMVGAIPERFGWQGGEIGHELYFAMARGSKDVPALEMTKWFDTNYHYQVPEIAPDQEFQFAGRKVISEFKEAKAAGFCARPVLLGPVSFLLLSKPTESGTDPLALLDRLLPVYEAVLSQLQEAGADWVQIDEPCLVLDLPERALGAYKPAYERLKAAASGLKLLIATYFEALPPANLAVVTGLAVDGIHLDLVRGRAQLDEVLDTLPDTMVLSAGVIDGRNVWRADLDAALAVLSTCVDRLGTGRVMVAPSCSLLHSPVDLDQETKLDGELRQWMAFAKQKLVEIAALAMALRNGREAVAEIFDASAEASRSRRESSRIHNPQVTVRSAGITEKMAHRASSFPARRNTQAAALKLPLLPTTTIGSFPQTDKVRKARASFRRGETGRADYDAFLREETEEAIRFQERLDIDVLVHGEFERNDMVEYFGELLDGFVFTSGGWVQSYGTRCVKPPIIFGDVSRPKPMTVEWTAFAQSLTDRMVKGMLTGPVTILQWSFVRDDQPRSETCRQIALAIRDEVVDLEAAGVQIIQIDEPAFREGLPLRNGDWEGYLAWAAECFRLSSSGVRDETQIHTHMCYSEFNDIIESIANLDADVISIETSRSRMELLDAFVEFHYPNEIGPGVYDIHSPRVPAEQEMVELLEKAIDRLAPDQVWVNPDCGLKTRDWPETEAALRNLVSAAKHVRARLNG